MFTPIHQALGLEPGELSAELIEQAVENHVEETAALDWKSALYPSKKQGWDDEVAKDIAAMANSGGGWIVFGVVEDPETGAAAEVKPIHWNQNEHQRILRAAYSRIGPPVLGVEFFAFPKGEGHLVMMRIPDSHAAPHFARKGSDAFIAPRRNGPHTAFMSEAEIERGFRARFQRKEDREKELKALFERTAAAVDPSVGVCISIVAIPRDPASGLPPLRKDEARSSAFDDPSSELFLQNSIRLAKWVDGDVRKGLRQWVAKSHRGSNFVCRKLMFDDGAVACAYRLGALFVDKSRVRQYPVDEPNHCVQSHVESAIIDFVSLLRRHAASRQANGGYQVRAGLVSEPGEAIYIRRWRCDIEELSDVDESEPILEFQPVTVLIDPLAPFGDLLPSVNDLALDIINQGGLQFLQVIATVEES